MKTWGCTVQMTETTFLVGRTWSESLWSPDTWFKGGFKTDSVSYRLYVSEHLSSGEHFPFWQSFVCLNPKRLGWPSVKSWAFRTGVLEGFSWGHWLNHCFPPGVLKSPREQKACAKSVQVDVILTVFSFLSWQDDAAGDDTSTYSRITYWKTTLALRKVGLPCGFVLESPSWFWLPAGNQGGWCNDSDRLSRKELWPAPRSLIATTTFMWWDFWVSGLEGVFLWMYVVIVECEHVWVCDYFLRKSIHMHTNIYASTV